MTGVQLVSILSGPTFLATNASTQSISTSVFTQVTLGTEIFDTNNNFASNRFTPTVAGYYQINGSIFGTDTVAVTQLNVSIYKNGSEYIRGNTLQYAAAVTGGSVGVVNHVIQLNGSTDYVELWGLIVGTSPSFGRTSAPVACYFSGSLICKL